MRSHRPHIARVILWGHPLIRSAQGSPRNPVQTIRPVETTADAKYTIVSGYRGKAEKPTCSEAQNPLSADTAASSIRTNTAKMQATAPTEELGDSQNLIRKGTASTIVCTLDENQTHKRHEHDKCTKSNPQAPQSR